ncbi:unnamed protein product [Tilletia caries]|nr:unnamed protein product [Tilletia caries]
MSRQRSAVGQNQNPFGLTGTGSGSSSPSSSSAFKRITAELAQIRKDQHRLFASVQNVVSNQQTGQSTGTASRASDIPPGVIFTATGGPAVPPKGVKHNHSLILRNARSLVTEKMGDRGKRPYEYDYPKTVSAWPLRVIAGRDGDPDREVRLLRLNWSKSYMSEEVQSQLRCIFDYILTHRRAHGVPAHLTREHLVSLFRNTYEYWQRQHRLRRTAKGRSQTAQEKVRSKLLSRRRAKLSARTEALGIAELVRYADGTTLSRKGKAKEAKVAARGLDMRADIEFAVQMAVHSPEEVEMESHNNSERMVVRPMFLEWRSLELLDGLKWMDDNRKCLRPHPVRRCLHVFRQSSNFRLPSTVRRWMAPSYSIEWRILRSW